MRIKKGDKVEVWSQDAAPPMGAWRGGEVHWGNGHSYQIRWDDGSEVSNRIPRKSVRPRPPPFPARADLAAGDMVEVLDQGVWKCAEVVPAACGEGGAEFRVKIVGTSDVLTAPLRLLRARQVLGDDDLWVALYKGKNIPGKKEPASRGALARMAKCNGGGGGGALAGMAKCNGGGGKFPQPAPDTKWAKIKRSHSNADVERIETNAKRICAREEEEEDEDEDDDEQEDGEVPRYNNNVEVIDVNPALFLNKQQEMSSSSSSSEDCDGTGSNHQDGGGGKKSASSSVGSSSSSSSSDSDSTDSDSSDGDSGGERAIISASNRPSGEVDDHQRAASPPRGCQEEDFDNDRTESRDSGNRRPADDVRTVAAAAAAGGGGDDRGVALAGAVHRLELEAYTALMRAFHATGLLTWNKEELLTNLRLHLNISSDEHLRVIWDLNGKRRLRKHDQGRA